MEKNTRLHTYVMLLLNDKQETQASLAQEVGATPQMVSYILLGQRRSADIELAIANHFGFDSFSKLINSADIFFDAWNAGLICSRKAI